MEASQTAHLMWKILGFLFVAYIIKMIFQRLYPTPSTGATRVPLTQQAIPPSSTDSNAVHHRNVPFSPSSSSSQRPFSNDSHSTINRRPPSLQRNPSAHSTPSLSVRPSDLPSHPFKMNDHYADSPQERQIRLEARKLALLEKARNKFLVKETSKEHPTQNISDTTTETAETTDTQQPLLNTSDSTLSSSSSTSTTTNTESVSTLPINTETQTTTTSTSNPEQDDVETRRRKTLEAIERRLI
eukprot:TRINITY_DN5993_c0_g1_i1.p1 TRINITY_DN5993_c0_g1~~TRINITY_DN5993_c0_g1_i1.p1  ORF type:complete len:242 (-),score=50.77 TRINITY_DN5993_c0_g1_i1:16-741(-)